MKKNMQQMNEKQKKVKKGTGMEAVTARFSTLLNSSQFLSGLWDNILQHLVEVTGRKAGRNPYPTYAIIDSQSVDTAYARIQKPAFFLPLTLTENIQR